MHARDPLDGRSHTVRVFRPSGGGGLMVSSGRLPARSVGQSQLHRPTMRTTGGPVPAGRAANLIAPRNLAWVGGSGKPRRDGGILINVDMVNGESAM